MRVIKLTKDFVIQILTGQLLDISLRASMHCLDLFSASCRCTGSLRQMMMVWMERAPNKAGTLVNVNGHPVSHRFMDLTYGSGRI
jgi:hypothetical protein